jgi:DNA-binding HxlR family transcriptional regulator
LLDETETLVRLGCVYQPKIGLGTWLWSHRCAARESELEHRLVSFVNSDRLTRMHPDRFRYRADNCSIARTLDIVGEKWSLLVLREAFYGVRRFSDFQRALGCARNLLSARLATLVAEGILSREPYREPGRRARFEYRLTDKGLELFPALVALMQWGDRWTSDPAGPPVEVRHRECGEPVAVELRCAAGHRPLSARDTEALPGAGALPATADRARRRSRRERGRREPPSRSGYSYPGSPERR